MPISGRKSFFKCLIILPIQSFIDSVISISRWQIFYAIFISWELFTLAIMVPVLKQVYHVTDPVIVIVSAAGSFIRQTVFLTAGERNNLYIGGFLDMFNLAGLVACRSGK